MDRYMVFVAGTLINTFDTYAEAKNSVNDIISKYPFINPDTVYVTRYTIQ